MIAITRGGQYHPEAAALYLAKGEIPYGLFNPVTHAEKLKPRLCSAEVESSRTSLASRTSSRTDFEVLGLGLGLEGQVLGLGLEASSPRKLACPRLEDSTIFWKAKILWSG